MDFKSIQDRYRLFYSSTQYSTKTGRATNISHEQLEAGLETCYFANVLEVGAGSGEHLTYVSHGFDTYVVSDLFLPKLIPEAKIYANKIGPFRKVVTKSENAEQLSFPNSSFDRVLSTCLLHHLGNPLSALEELRRVAKHGCLVSIYLPSDPGLLYRFAQRAVSTQALLEFFNKKEIAMLRAGEHRNHAGSLAGLIEGVFSNDSIKVKFYPFFGFGWNFSLFRVYSIKINKKEMFN